MIRKPKCGKCGFWSNGSQCGLTNYPMTAEDFCSQFSISPLRCSKCGGLIPPKVNSYVENFETLCENCFKALGSCGACRNGQYCAFQQDTNCREPQQVQQQIRQGNMIMNTMVQNPKRVAATCQKGCPCWNGSCMRQVGKCGNYK